MRENYLNVKGLNVMKCFEEPFEDGEYFKKALHGKGTSLNKEQEYLGKGIV